MGRSDVDRTLHFGQAGDYPFVGWWNPTLPHQTIATFTPPQTWKIDWNGNGIWDGIVADRQYNTTVYESGSVPVAGDWTGSAKLELASSTMGRGLSTRTATACWEQIAHQETLVMRSARQETFR